MSVLLGIDHFVTVRFTDLLRFNTIAELPLKGITFSKVLNGSGAWQGTLNVEDEKVREAAWRAATAVNKTAMWLDIDGKLLYGGSLSGRQYKMLAGTATLSGNDFCSYLAQRTQARDYTAYKDPEGHEWSTKGAPAGSIGYWMLKHALEKAFSIPVEVVLAAGPEPEKKYWITFSAPEAQQQALGSLLSQLQTLGYLIGIDYAQDVVYGASGAPRAQITISYPRRGVASPPSAPVIDLGSALDLEYNEDGTQQADRIVEQAGATTVRTGTGIWLPAQAQGYPLFEAVVSHPALTSATKTAAVLEAYVSGDLSVRAYPFTTPVVTLPMFGSPSILDLDVGQDVLLYAPKPVGDEPSSIPIFPVGLAYFPYRIVQIEGNIPDEGEPTMVLTLSIPPSVLPVTPFEITSAEEQKQKEKEREEKGEPPPEPPEPLPPGETQKQKEEREAAEAKAKKEREEEEARLEKERLEREKREKEEAEKHKTKEETEKELIKKAKESEECCTKRGEELKRLEEEGTEGTPEGRKRREEKRIEKELKETFLVHQIGAISGFATEEKNEKGEGTGKFKTISANFCPLAHPAKRIFWVAEGPVIVSCGGCVGNVTPTAEGSFEVKFYEAY